MSFLRKKPAQTSQTVAGVSAGTAVNVLTQPPPVARWTFTGTDSVRRAFSPEHIAVLEAAYNRPQGNESVTSVVINGSNYIAGSRHAKDDHVTPLTRLIDFSKMTLRQSSCPGYTSLNNQSYEIHRNEN